MKSILLICLIALFSCKKKDEATIPAVSGVQVYINAKIYTVNESQPWAEAMLVENGVITKVGTNAQINAAFKGLKPTDLKGKLVLPGLHDVHLHPLEAASENFQFSLSTSISKAENYAFDIQKAVKSNTDKDWILGWGFDIHVLLNSDKSPIDILDEISNTKPIAVMELTSHSIWVNSKALEMAGLSGSSLDPIGGVIMKDKDGKPNGLLIDNAGNLIIDLAVASIPNNEQNDYQGLVGYALPELAKNGITSICDARTYWKRNHHKTWKQVADDGNLTCRVNLGLWAYPEEDDAVQLSKLKSLYAFDENSLLKINQIKLYSDGIIINTTSAMHSDFKIDLFNRPTNNGVNYFSEERLTKYIQELGQIGFDFHIHAIGNRGVHESLNAIQNGGNSNGRHRITHVEFVDPVDYPRFKSLNATADAQVAGGFTQPEFWHDNDEFVDASLNNNNVPIRSLIDAGARLTLSSDWDVSELNPFVGMQNAITRSPQNIPLEEAVKAYTINAAYVMRQESKVGSIEVGKEADFIVLNQNIFEVGANQISMTKVLQTYLRGELVYE